MSPPHRSWSPWFKELAEEARIERAFKDYKFTGFWEVIPIAT